MSREEFQTMFNSLLESSDGTRADDYAVIAQEVGEMYDETDKLNGRIDELETQNGALKKENFKLFSRVGAKKVDDTLPPIVGNGEDEEDSTDYLADILDDKGGWK